MSKQRTWLILARKLVEVFAASHDTNQVFTRYWRLAGPLEGFCEQAATPLEREVAKALRTALEERLREWAPGALHPDADAVAAFLSAYPRKRQKPWVSMHRYRSSKPRAKSKPRRS